MIWMRYLRMKIKEKNFVSVVVYIHNNEMQISSFLKTIIGCMQKYFVQSEIICVDDFSIDDSVSKIKEICKIQGGGICGEGGSNLTLLSLDYYHGVETAMNMAANLSIGDFIFEFDSLQWELQVDDIWDAYKKVLTGYDIVSVAPSRNSGYFANGFYCLLNSNIVLPHKIGTEVFRVLSRRAFNRIHDLNHLISYRKVNYAECGLSMEKIQKDIPIFKNYRKPDKQERKFKWKLAIDVLFKNTNLCLKGTILLSAIILLGIVVLLVFKVLFGLGICNLVNPNIMVILLLVICFISTSLFAVVIKYQMIMIKNIYRRKDYSYKNIEKLTK